jgi:Pheophorbide a oxygenase
MCLHVCICQDDQPSPYGANALVLPVWLRHAVSSLFLHQDMVLLHGQEQRLRERGVTASNFHNHVYTPGGQDTGVYILKVYI